MVFHHICCNLFALTGQLYSLHHSQMGILDMAISSHIWSRFSRQAMSISRLLPNRPKLCFIKVKIPKATANVICNDAQAEQIQKPGLSGMVSCATQSHTPAAATIAEKIILTGFIVLPPLLFMRFMQKHSSLYKYITFLLLIPLEYQTNKSLTVW